MAASSDWKVYTRDREYVASCKYASDAAAVVSLYGDGATIRYRHGRVLWTEGKESQPAGESYDFVDATVAARMLRAMTDRV